MELRLRRKPIGEIVRNLDAFPKVGESLVEEKKASGGLLLLICFLLIIWLVCGEIQYYNEAHFEYKFLVDTDYHKKLQLDIDMTVASPCDLIGADIMDSTGQSLPYVYGDLKTEPAKFTLNKFQREYFNVIKQAKKKRVGEVKKLDNLMLIKQHLLKELALEHRDDDNDGELNACRIHGSLKINKVEGNLHVTSGKSLPLVGGGHAHLNFFGLSANFSHRIQRLSFGPEILGMINPLDGLEKMDNNERYLFQYYLQIVPTEFYNSFDGRVLKTCQYSMTQRNRVIDHDQGSHGMPGIYFKYDLSPVMVRIEQNGASLIALLLRLACIIGGVFVTSGLINSIVSFFVCRFSACKKPCLLVNNKLEQKNHEKETIVANSSISM